MTWKRKSDITTLNNLGKALLNRFEELGEEDDLEEAIASHREALILRPVGPLLNLANALRISFKELGRLEDMEEAIKYNREALTFLPLGHPNSFMSLNGLANAFIACFEHSERLDDVEEAINGALALAYLSHSDHSKTLTRLANAVHGRFEQLGRKTWKRQSFPTVKHLPCVLLATRIVLRPSADLAVLSLSIDRFV